MTNEIKEILYLEDYINKYKNDEKSIINGNRLTTPAMLDYLEVKALLDYITNLQEENKEYKRLMFNADINSVDYVYDKDTKLYTFDRKNWYKINKKLDERFNYKQIIDKAIEYINSDTHLEGWINIEHYGEREQDLLNILKGSDKE